MSSDEAYARFVSEFSKLDIPLADNSHMIIATSCVYSESFLRSDMVETWEIAQSWIMNCVVNHPDCTHIRTGSSHKPSRLIAVGTCIDFSDVHLCMSNEIPADFQYATLSHSWGGYGSSMKLVRDLEQDYKQQIPWEPLPQTFKDAIHVVRKLQAAFGVHCIWIDALGILEDSIEDWCRDIKNMSNIYYYSFCNLAACLGPNSHYGLLCDRDRLSSHMCVVQAQIDDNPRSSFEIEICLGLHTDVQSSDLESRAWVLQEILLAQRVLYFTPQKIFWECGSLCAHEGAPNGVLIG